MAYLKWWRELPTACALCRVRSPGGLCAECRLAVCATVRGGRRRCPRCDLCLDDVSAQPAVCADLSDQLANSEEPLRTDGVDFSGCPDCRESAPVFDRVVAAFDYGWPGELLIQQLKLQSRYSAAPMLARLIADRCGAISAESHWAPSTTLVAPVPASRRSINLRGFNPAAEVGRQVARQLGMAWRPEILRRVRDGDRQKSLSRAKRREEVQGLYACSDAVVGKEIMVVDDVMTTGSTLNAIAGVLKAQGASKVWGVVVARTPFSE